MGLADVDHRLVDDGQQLGGRDALGGLDLLQAVIDRLGVDGGVFLGLRVLGALKLVLEVLDLLQHRLQLLEVFLVNLQLEEELAEIRAEQGLAFPELGEDALLVGLGAGLDVFGPGLGDARLGLLGVFDQLGQGFEVGLAAVDFLVDDDAVEAFLAGEELGAEASDVGADGGGFEEGGLGLEFGVLDALGDLDFLFARQQRDLAHLLEIHAHRVVEDVVLRGTGLLLLGLLHALLEIVNLIGLEDLDLKVLQNGEDVVDFLLVLDRLRQRFVDVVEGEVALLLGVADELADLLVDAPGGGIGAGGLGFVDDFLDGLGLGIGMGGLGFARHDVKGRGRCSGREGEADRLAEQALDFGTFF